MHVGVVQISGHAVSIVSVVFGFIGMRMGLGSIHGFIKPSGEKMFWWFGHMQGMIASYIAAMTAFSAVNLGYKFGGAWWIWLWPTIVGVPAIALWTAYYKKKFLPKPKTATA
jgi:H+/Cl- antiporter ClcA